MNDPTTQGLADDTEVDVPATEPDPPTDDTIDDDPPDEPVPEDGGTPEDGVPAALFSETDPAAEPESGTEP